MISFIKKLFGFGSTETATAVPYKIEPKTTATTIEPATPVIKAETAAVPAPAKRNRRPRNRSKAKTADSTPAKVAPVKSTKPKHAEKAK